MSLYCDLDLGNSIPIFSHGITSWWCITIPSLVTKGTAVLKTSFRQTLILTVHTKQSNIFTVKALAYGDLPPVLLWLWNIHSKDSRNGHIFYYICDTEDSKTNLYAWHSSSWWCTTKPRLVTKGWAVQTISRQNLDTCIKEFMDIVTPVCPPPPPSLQGVWKCTEAGDLCPIYYMILIFKSGIFPLPSTGTIICIDFRTVVRLFSPLLECVLWSAPPPIWNCPFTCIAILNKTNKEKKNVPPHLYWPLIQLAGCFTLKSILWQQGFQSCNIMRPKKLPHKCRYEMTMEDDIHNMQL